MTSELDLEQRLAEIERLSSPASLAQRPAEDLLFEVYELAGARHAADPTTPRPRHKRLRDRDRDRRG